MCDLYKSCLSLTYIVRESLFVRDIVTDAVRDSLCETSCMGDLCKSCLSLTPPAHPRLSVCHCSRLVRACPLIQDANQYLRPQISQNGVGNGFRKLVPNNNVPVGFEKRYSYASSKVRSARRVTGINIRDYTRGCNNCAHMCTQLSALDVTEKNSLIVCISSRIGEIWVLSQLSLCPHIPAHSYDSYFSICEQFLSPDPPQIFWYRFTK